MKVEKKILNYLQELSVGRPPASGPNSNCTRQENMDMLVEMAYINFEVFEKNRYWGGGLVKGEIKEQHLYCQRTHKQLNLIKR